MGVAIVAVGVAWAAQPNKPDKADDVAVPDAATEAEWLEVVSSSPGLLLAEAKGADTKRVDAAENRANLQRRANGAADKARDFYTRHPAHAGAPTARAIEAMAMLRAVDPGRPADVAAALKVAADFRKENRFPAAHRFKVAYAAERLRHGQANGAKAAPSEAELLEGVADDLRLEFGDVAPVHTVYADALRKCPPDSAYRLANKLVAMKPPPELLAHARAEIVRHRLLGKPLDLKLATADGGNVDLGKANGAVRILCFCGPHDRMDRFQGAGDRAVEWMHVVVGAEAPTTATAPATRAGQTPLPILHCVERAGFNGQACRRLGITRTPYALILDASGRVAAYGELSQLTVLLQTTEGRK